MNTVTCSVALTPSLFSLWLQFSTTDVRPGDGWHRWHVGGVSGGRADERRRLHRGLPPPVQVRSISEGRGGGREALSVSSLRRLDSVPSLLDARKCAPTQIIG